MRRHNELVPIVWQEMEPAGYLSELLRLGKWAWQLRELEQELLRQWRRASGTRRAEFAQPASSGLIERK